VYLEETWEDKAVQLAGGGALSSLFVLAKYAHHGMTMSNETRIIDLAWRR